MEFPRFQADNIPYGQASTLDDRAQSPRKTYGSRWLAALSFVNTGELCLAISRFYDGLKAYGETGSRDILPDLRLRASEAFDLVAGNSAYARGLLADEFDHCITLMDEVRWGGYASTRDLGAILQKRITESAMLATQLVSMLLLGIPVSTDTYGDACAISVLGVFMHDSLGSVRSGWTQANKTIKHCVDVDSRAAALFSLVCACLIADSSRNQMGATALDLVRADLTSNICESRYEIGEELLALANDDNMFGQPPDFGEVFYRLEKALREVVCMRHATLSPQVMQAIKSGPQICSALIRQSGRSFKADAANFARFCWPSLYTSLSLAGQPDTDLTAFSLYYVMCITPPWLPIERISALVTVHRVLNGLEGAEPGGITSEVDAKTPTAIALEAIDCLRPTNTDMMDLRETCRTQFALCWELRRDRDATWRCTQPTDSANRDISNMHAELYFCRRRCEGLWDLSDYLSAAAQGVSIDNDIPAAAVRAAIISFESLSASRRTKQDQGQLVDFDGKGKSDAATKAALGIYALPDYDYGIGMSPVRSPRLSIIASVYSQVLPLPGNALWSLLSK